MPSYLIEQYEIVSTLKRVVAGSEAEAIQRLLKRENAGELVEPGTEEFIKRYNDDGMIPDHNLKSELMKLNVMYSDDQIIPSIRSIQKEN